MWIITTSRYGMCSIPSLEYLYGINPILIALKEGRRKGLKLFVSSSEVIQLNSRITKIVNESKKLDIPLVFVTKTKLDNLVKGQPHQNVVLRC